MQRFCRTLRARSLGASFPNASILAGGRLHWATIVAHSVRWPLAVFSKRPSIKLKYIFHLKASQKSIKHYSGSIRSLAFQLLWHGAVKFSHPLHCIDDQLQGFKRLDIGGIDRRFIATCQIGVGVWKVA